MSTWRPNKTLEEPFIMTITDNITSPASAMRFPGLWLSLVVGRTFTLMQIDYLADHQEFIPTLAHWHHCKWAYLRPGDFG
jgi:hypothetical protein